MASNDTPKHWKQYLEYVEKWNKDKQAEMDKMRLLDHEEYQALPWYMKLTKKNPDDIDLHYFFWAKEPNILDYYNWDVNIRKGK